MKVAISGGFDPIHVGHIRLIQAAANMGEVWVIMNNDAFLMRKKGYVFMHSQERQEILAAIEGVACVWESESEDDTVADDLEEMEPDIFANGGDRTEGNPKESEVCQRLGIKEVFNVGGGKIQSSSDLVGRMK